MFNRKSSFYSIEEVKSSRWYEYRSRNIDYKMLRINFYLRSPVLSINVIMSIMGIYTMQQHSKQSNTVIV